MSCNLFNFVIAGVLWKAGLNGNDTIFSTADHINIIGRSKRDVTAGLSAIKSKSADVDLAGKTKYMLLPSRDMLRIGYETKTGSYIFDVVTMFVYHDSTVISKNDVVLEIKRRISFTNKCFYYFSKASNWKRSLMRRNRMEDNGKWAPAKKTTMATLEEPKRGNSFINRCF